MVCCGVVVKYTSICIAHFYTKRLKCAPTWITQFYLQIAPGQHAYLYSPRRRAWPPFCLYSFYRPTESRRLSRPGWLVTYWNKVPPLGVYMHWLMHVDYSLHASINASCVTSWLQSLLLTFAHERRLDKKPNVIAWLVSNYDRLGMQHRNVNHASECVCPASRCIIHLKQPKGPHLLTHSRTGNNA